MLRGGDVREDARGPCRRCSSTYVEGIAVVDDKFRRRKGILTYSDDKIISPIHDNKRKGSKGRGGGKKRAKG
ncbi:hypothetical protein ACP70R_049745 [Stipagrostis hirtigluma subsp. patula]